MREDCDRTGPVAIVCVRVSYFADLRAKTTAAAGPPPLGLHALMGSSRQEKIANMIENISQGRIAPVELIARKR